MLPPPPRSPLFPYTTLFRSLFGYFLTVTQTPQKVTEFLTGLGLGRYGVLALIMLMYLVLGCLMDAHQVHQQDRKSTRLNSSHLVISYAVFCLKKKKRILIPI